MLMYCSNCGSPQAGGNFCQHCGSQVQKPAENLSAWRDLKQRLEANWGSQIEISPQIFYGFVGKDWAGLQFYIRDKTNFALGWRSFADFSQRFRLSEEERVRELAPGEMRYVYLDTLDALVQAISTFRAGLRPTELSRQLAASGTLAQFPYGTLRSGNAYSDEALEQVEVELGVVEKLIKEVTGLGSSYSQYLESEYPLTGIGPESIELLSDFGRSLLVSHLTKTETDGRFLKSWAPDPTKISEGMTPVLVAGLSFLAGRHGVYVNIHNDAMINPRYVSLLLDEESNLQPWWMEMGLWGSAVTLWKSKIQFSLDDLDFEMILDCLKNSLTSAHSVNSGAADVFLKDAEQLQELIDYLEAL